MGLNPEQVLHKKDLILFKIGPDTANNSEKRWFAPIENEIFAYLTFIL